MIDIYTFEWPVDQAGYEIQKRREPLASFIPDTHPLPPRQVDFIGPQGGPPRYYRPMEEGHLGLWRQFAETCISPEGALSFVHAFGLLSGPYDHLDSVLGMARDIREIAAAWDAGERETAEKFYSQYAGAQLLGPVIYRDAKRGKSELKFAPKSLSGALIIQVGEAITRNRQFRRCRNENCAEWFRLGQGGASTRREFCSDRCRVAWARRHKQRRAADA